MSDRVVEEMRALLEGKHKKFSYGAELPKIQKVVAESAVAYRAERDKKRPLPPQNPNGNGGFSNPEVKPELETKQASRFAIRAGDVWRVCSSSEYNAAPPKAGP
jgi:hypothetical protein